MITCHGLSMETGSHTTLGGRPMLKTIIAMVLLLTAPLAAQEVNTSQLSENGWFSDDTRADGSGSEAAGTNLISDTLTDDPEAGGSGSSTHDADILGQIIMGLAPGTVPSGTHAGSAHLLIDAIGGAAGKSQISHRKDDGTGHGPGSAFGPGFTAEYSWMGDGTVSVTTSLKFGIKTADFGSTGVSSRTGENVWDKVLIYEPGNLNGGTSDALWHTETVDFTTGKWWFFDRTVGASIIGTPMTLSDMSTDLTPFSGAKTPADVYALITAAGAHITSVQFGIGSGNAGGSVYVNQLETNAYRSGMTTTFGCGDYDQGFEVDDIGWNVFGAGFASTRVPSGTDGVTSASGSWHEKTTEAAAGNWGGYGGNCGCASGSCALAPFPTGGYRTSIDIYLDVGAGYANDTRFDFSSAINDAAGSHRRDFIFNAAFLDTTEVVSVGAGLDRFVVAASNNTLGFPQGGVDPVAITATGWYTFGHRFYDSGGGILACDFSVVDTAGDTVAQWTRSDASDIIGSTVGGNRYAWFAANQFPALHFDNARRLPGADTGELVLSAPDCQDDAFPGGGSLAGTQIAVDLSMTLDGAASGFAAFIDYDVGTLSYRGDLSTYSPSPFSLHIGSILQADDGTLEIDGSVGFFDPPTLSGATLATLVFDVVAECGVGLPISFETGGAFPSELSNLGDPLPTTLVEPAPFTLDDTPPVLTACPADITQAADAGSCTGAVVTYTAPTATDNCDPSPAVVCSPASGSTFPVGTTTVTCTATDACGNTDTCMFDVTVTPTNLVDVVVELTDSVATTRCIHFATNVCGVFADADLVFSGGLPATAVATVEIPCGVYTDLCAKDEQHTKWSPVPVPLSIVGSKYVAASTFVLDAGDTDNDGDVDINDVTLFLAQYGGFAASGGCPYDGVTKDGDFSNNGTILAEDYVPLSNNWLTSSSCPCAATYGPREQPETTVRVHDALTDRADLNRDGRVDVADVEVLEQRHGLSGALSKRMHESAGR